MATLSFIFSDPAKSGFTKHQMLCSTLSRISTPQPQKISYKIFNGRRKPLPICCSSSLPWETSDRYTSAEDSIKVMEGGDIVESLASSGTSKFPMLEREADVLDTNEDSIKVMEGGDIVESLASSGTSASAEDSIKVMEGGDIVESLASSGTSEFPMLEREADVLDTNDRPSILHQSLKWPLWLLGPSMLLVTGMLPTLWLPLSSVFLGPNSAGLLSLVGLDCIFNMGATLFLLMADACARPKNTPQSNISRVPINYRLWNLFASITGFIAPLVVFFLSNRGIVEPNISFIAFMVLLGPYLLLLGVQMLTEMLTWHWKSPVWLVIPVVYESYRILQLMRGLRLGTEIGAPGWAILSIRGLVSWWVLILGVQLMRVAWFAGYASRAKDQI